MHNEHQMKKKIKEQNGKGDGVRIELNPLIKIKWLPYLITLSP